LKQVVSTYTQTLALSKGPCSKRMKFNTRQAGVVIGLTLILTLPVTVVSGVGSEKKSVPHFRYTISSSAVWARGYGTDARKMTETASIPKRVALSQEGGGFPFRLLCLLLREPCNIFQPNKHNRQVHYATNLEEQE
jgi:hypothetical protein